MIIKTIMNRKIHPKIFHPISKTGFATFNVAFRILNNNTMIKITTKTIISILTTMMNEELHYTALCIGLYFLMMNCSIHTHSHHPSLHQVLHLH